jgi:hypothetical protein
MDAPARHCRTDVAKMQRIEGRPHSLRLCACWSESGKQRQPGKGNDCGKTGDTSHDDNLDE